MEAEPQEIYDVEKIIGKKIINDQVEYLVKWSDFSSKHNSWEPLANLDCADLISKFEKSEAHAIIGMLILI